MNSPQRPVERREGLSRWEEVLAPSFKIQEPSGRSCEAAWVKRLRLNAKDLTGKVGE
jgi:hypothetical protein